MRVEPRDLRITLRFSRDEEIQLERAADGRSMGRMRETVEEQLLEFVHGELRLRIFDPDDSLGHRFMETEPGDEVEVIVERATGRRRPLYVRVFGGLVDCATGVRVDRSRRQVELTAYSYSQRFAQVSAEGVRRDVSGVTGTVSSGSKVVTVSDASLLEDEDEITLRDDVADETHTIVSVDKSANTVTTDEAWDHGFTDAPLTLETPYYRSKTISELAELVVQEAGLDGPTVVLEETLSEIPFADSMNDSGLGRNDVRGMTIIGGKIVVWEGTQAYEADDPWSGFSSASHGDVKADWRPYATTEPSSLVEIAAVDNGQRVPSIAGGHYYYIDHRSCHCVYRDDGIHVPDQAGLIASTSLEFCDATQVLHEPGGRWKADEWEGGSYRYDADLNELPEWPSVTSHADFRGLPDGNLLALTSRNYEQLADGWLKVLDGSTGQTIRELEYREGIDRWTFRRFGDYLGALRERNDGWYFVLWLWQTGEIIAEYKITSGTGGRAFLTVWKDPTTGEEHAVGFAGPVDGTTGRYFVLSRKPSGVVPYADFDGMSCAEALRQLALISASYLAVDEYGHVWLVGRSTTLSRLSRGVREIEGEIYGKVLRPVWEWYRTSVAVQATSPDDEDIEMIVGASGDPAHRLDVSVSLPISWGLAGQLGPGYLAFHARVLPQAELTIDEPDDRPIGVLEHILLDDGAWLVLEAETDLVRRTQKLVAVRTEEVA